MDLCSRRTWRFRKKEEEEDEDEDEDEDEEEEEEVEEGSSWKRAQVIDEFPL